MMPVSFCSCVSCWSMRLRWPEVRKRSRSITLVCSLGSRSCSCGRREPQIREIPLPHKYEAQQLTATYRSVDTLGPRERRLQRRSRQGGPCGDRVRCIYQCGVRSALGRGPTANPYTRSNARPATTTKRKRTHAPERSPPRKPCRETSLSPAEGLLPLPRAARAVLAADRGGVGVDTGTNAWATPTTRRAAEAARARQGFMTMACGGGGCD